MLSPRWMTLRAAAMKGFFIFTVGPQPHKKQGYGSYLHISINFSLTGRALGGAILTRLFRSSLVSGDGRYGSNFRKYAPAFLPRKFKHLKNRHGLL